MTIQLDILQALKDLRADHKPYQAGEQILQAPGSFWSNWVHLKDAGFITTRYWGGGYNSCSYYASLKLARYMNAAA